MRELEAIKVTTTALEPSCEQTLILSQPHPVAILLSHFEVTELSPASSFVALTELRVGRLHYLIAPVPLALIQREQLYAKERAEQKTRQQLQKFLGSVPPHLLQRFRSDRRTVRLLELDIRWKPGQLLTVTFKNAGPSVVDKIVIELVLYAFEATQPVTN